MQQLIEILQRFGAPDSLKETGARGFVLLLWLVLALRLRKVSSGHQRWLLAVGGLATLVAFAGCAFERAWLADDAFISFRYAANLARGHGLVWNHGERVEGFTNFLWTVCLAAWEWLGVQAPYAALLMQFGAVVAFLSATFVVVARAWPGTLPLFPSLLLLSPGVLEFGTSGLESLPAALAACWAAISLVRSSSQANLWVLVAALLRPDHALLFVPMAFVALVTPRARVSFAASAGAFVVYWLGRWWYFGAPFPNTFYAKSGGASYWAQGATYASEAILASGLVPVLVVGLVVVVALPLRSLRSRSALFYSGVGAFLVLVYVIRVGGDFMEHRFLLTPIALAVTGIGVVLHEAVATGLLRNRHVLIGLLSVSTVSSCYTPQLVAPGEKRWHIARESSFYRLRGLWPLAVDSAYFRTARAVQELVGTATDAPMLAAGCIGMIGYLSPNLDVFDTYGLTSVVGRKDVTTRGRPGHEKHASPEEVLSSGAGWSIDPLEFDPLGESTRVDKRGSSFYVLRAGEWTDSRLGVVLPAALNLFVTHAQARHSRLRVETLLSGRADLLLEWERRWKIANPREFLVRGDVSLEFDGLRGRGEVAFSAGCFDGWRLTWEQQAGRCQSDACSEVVCSGDDIRLSGFRYVPMAVDASLLGGGAVSGAGVDEFAGMIRDAIAANEKLVGADVVARFGFDSPADLARGDVRGEAFGVTSGAVLGQQSVVGVVGDGLLNGFWAGDSKIGRIDFRVDLDRRRRYLVTGLTGGGSDCSATRVELSATGVGYVVCGRGDEVLRPFGFVIRDSDSVRVSAIDDAVGPWGHILLDDVLVVEIPDAT